MSTRQATAQCLAGRFLTMLLCAACPVGMPWWCRRYVSLVCAFAMPRHAIARLPTPPRSPSTLPPLPSRSKGHRTAVCEQCGKTFVHAGHLRRHVDSVHNKTRAHSCPQCNREFSELGNMRRHIRAVHEKRREHRCDACGQSFSAASNLKIHRQTVHQKIKAFACPVCDRKFGTSSNMVAHSRSVHGLESLWDCAHCGSSFATYDSLCRHIAALHEGKPVPSETELSASMKDRPA